MNIHVGLLPISANAATKIRIYIVLTHLIRPISINNRYGIDDGVVDLQPSLFTAE